MKKPIALCMIQPPPLPGSYRHKDMSIAEIRDAVLQEVRLVAELGFDGILLQNMNDMPIKQHASPEAIAYMSVLGVAIRGEFPKLNMGILMNWDGLAALAVADACGADFVRVEHLFTGVEVTSAGLIEGQCCEIAMMRKRLNTTIPVYADVYEVHGVPLGAKPVEDAAWESVNEAFADGLYIAGKTPAESIDMVHRARKRVPGTPIFLGGGATADNIFELLQHFDGVSVASWVKNGDMKRPLDIDRCKKFMAEVQRAKGAGKNATRSI